MTQQEFHSLLDRVKALTPEQMRQLRQEIESALVERSAAVEESAFEVLSRAGLIGCIEGGPGSPEDLSTNPKHMEGFGRE